MHLSRFPGNVFRLHKRKPDPSATHGRSLDPLDARGGSLPNVSPVVGSPDGLAIAYVHFRVKPGASAGIARFYRDVFGADAEEIAVSSPSGETCSLVRVLCLHVTGDGWGGWGWGGGASACRGGRLVDFLGPRSVWPSRANRCLVFAVVRF